jgi:hypothetical protein
MICLMKNCLFCWRIGMMKRRRIVTRAGLGLVALLLAAPGLNAQARQGRSRMQGPPEGRRAEMQRQVQRRFDRAIRERLGFDDAQMEMLMGITRERSQLRRELAQRKQRAQVKVRMLGQEDLGGAPLTDEAALEVLADLVAISQEEADLFAAEQAALLEVFSPTEVFQLQQLREQMAERIRGLRGEGRGGPGGPGGPGIPGSRDGSWFR